MGTRDKFGINLLQNLEIWKSGNKIWSWGDANYFASIQVPRLAAVKEVASLTEASNNSNRADIKMLLSVKTCFNSFQFWYSDDIRKDN